MVAGRKMAARQRGWDPEDREACGKAPGASRPSHPGQARQKTRRHRQRSADADADADKDKDKDKDNDGRSDKEAATHAAESIASSRTADGLPDIPMRLHRSRMHARVGPSRVRRGHNLGSQTRAPGEPSTSRRRSAICPQTKQARRGPLDSNGVRFRTRSDRLKSISVGRRERGCARSVLGCTRKKERRDG